MTEARLQEIASRLKALKASLGEGYWHNEEVRSLQEQLRHRIGRYGAWGPDKLPLHQRARRAAKYESEFARLLWPGVDEA